MNHAFTIIPLTIEAKGEIITNNLPEFRELVREALGNINRDLKTDEEFGQAELDIKALKEAEEAVKSAAVKAFDEQLKALVDGLNETAEEIRVPRLELEKLIAKRKEEVKSEIVEEFLAAFDIDPKDARKHFLAGMQTQIKGKRTVESMRTACRVYQTTQQAMILESRASIDKFVAKFGPDLVMDRRELELRKVDSVEAEIVRRVEAKKSAEALAKSQAEAAAAKEEADKAKRDLAEASKPPGVPVNEPTAKPQEFAEDVPPFLRNSGKTSNIEVKEPDVPAAQLSANDEWKAFKADCLTAFAPLKAARERLKHSKNIAKAQIFANGINKLWKEEMQ